jgi:hypothetical protein
MHRAVTVLILTMGLLCTISAAGVHSAADTAAHEGEPRTVPVII